MKHINIVSLYDDTLEAAKCQTNKSTTTPLFQLAFEVQIVSFQIEKSTVDRMFFHLMLFCESRFYFHENFGKKINRLETKRE